MRDKNRLEINITNFMHQYGFSAHFCTNRHNKNQVMYYLKVPYVGIHGLTLARSSRMRSGLLS